MRDPYADLRRALTVRRISLGWSMKELAKIMGIHPTTISNLESHAFPISNPALCQWAAALRCNINIDATITFGNPLPQPPRLYDITPSQEEDAE